MYGFDVETWLVPSRLEPQGALSARLSDLVRAYGKEGDLLIFWYGGPAGETGDGSGPLVWFDEYGHYLGVFRSTRRFRFADAGLNRRVGARINAGIVPMILGSSNGDVLTLYDCEANLGARTSDGTGVFGTLAASTHGRVLGFAGRRSFTRSLICIPERPLHMACGIAVLDVHRKLVNQAGRGRALDEVDCGADAQKGADAGPQASLPSAMRPSPGYCHLSRCGARSESKQPTIFLSPLDYPLEAFGRDSIGEELEVKVRLRLGKSDINVRTWKDWRTSAPPGAGLGHVRISRGCTLE